VNIKNEKKNMKSYGSTEISKLLVKLATKLFRR